MLHPRSQRDILINTIIGLIIALSIGLWMWLWG